MFLMLGGTGAYFLDLEAELGSHQRVEMDTPYGPAFPLFIPSHNERAAPTIPMAFASRHGERRLEVSPPFVNARANIWAAHALGVTAILGWNGVGAINPLLELHDMLVLDGILDATRTRGRHFAEPEGLGDRGRGAAEPEVYSLEKLPHDLNVRQQALRAALYHAARATTARAFPCGTYACTEGPRLETAAEIQALKRWEADVVGMTLVPEIFLAHELGIAYAPLAYVTNYATGLEPVDDAPRHFGVEVAQRCLAIVRQAIDTLGHEPWMMDG